MNEPAVEPSPVLTGGFPLQDYSGISPPQLAAGIDWFAATFPHVWYDPIGKLDRLGILPEPTHVGVDGRYRNIEAWYSDDTGAWIGIANRGKERATLIDLPGQALRARDMTGARALPMFDAMRDAGGHARRIDLAVDLIGDKAPTYRTVADGLRLHHVATHADGWDVHRGSTFDAGAAGWTIYVGSPRSSSRLRVYDKRAERLAKGCDDPGPWVRVEAVYREDAAHAVTLGLLDGAEIGPYIARICRWLTGPPGRHGERVSTAEWFLPVADHAQPLGLHRAAAPATAERLAWLETSVSNALAEATEAESEQWLLDLARARRLRSDPARSARVAAYRQERRYVEA